MGPPRGWCDDRFGAWLRRPDDLGPRLCPAAGRPDRLLRRVHRSRMPRSPRGHHRDRGRSQTHGLDAQPGIPCACVRPPRTAHTVPMGLTHTSDSADPLSVKASSLRVGDLVEVRSEEEILSTLDAAGKHDALPFMPEMLAYCGKRFRISGRAYKACDTISWRQLRRLENAVHL